MGAQDQFVLEVSSTEALLQDVKGWSWLSPESALHCSSTWWRYVFSWRFSVMLQLNQPCTRWWLRLRLGSITTISMMERACLGQPKPKSIVWGCAYWTRLEHL